MKRFVSRSLTLILAGLVTVLVGCGGQPHSLVPGSTAAPIPWISNPGTPLAAVTVHAQSACRAADLSVQAGRAGAYQGFASQDLTLTNRGASPCFLSGPPAAAALLDDGSRFDAAGNTGSGVANRLDLADGQTAHLMLGTTVTCADANHPKVASHVQLTLATGEQVSVSGTWLNVACGAPRVVLFYADPAPAVDVPASGLKATFSGPGSVARGSVLEYDITLRNPTNAAVTLNPCPSYTQALGTSPAQGVEQTMLLNCGAMLSIGAGASVVFEMQLSVPATFPSGVTKLGWSLQVPDGPAAGAVIQIT